MNEPQQRHARAWQLSSTIILSLAIAGITWLMSVVSFLILDLSDILNHAGRLSFILATIISLIVLAFFLSAKWKSIGSSKLYASEFIVGIVFIFGGLAYAYYGHLLVEAHVPTGFLSGLKYAIMMIVGIYIASVGSLFSIAGVLGKISKPKT